MVYKIKKIQGNFIKLLFNLFKHPEYLITTVNLMGFPGGSDNTESAYNTGYFGLIPGSGKCPGEGNGYLLQCSCLENSMDRGAWRATYSPQGCKELDMTEHS